MAGASVRCRTVVEVETIRSVNGASDVEANIRYFLSSRDAGDPMLKDAARRHWSIENSLHWMLDVTFNEDQSRIRDRAAATGWAVLRKIALNLLKSDAEARTSIRGRHREADAIGRLGQRVYGPTPSWQSPALALPLNRAASTWRPRM